MLKPDYATARKLAKNYSVIPVCREILGDSTTPIAVLKRLAAKSSRYFLLESVLSEGKGKDPGTRRSIRNN